MARAETQDALTPDQALAGRRACFIVHDLGSGKPLTAFGGAQCAKRLPPCQTFDIVTALLGLDAGAVFDERTLLKPDASAPAEARPTTMAEAFARGADWWFDSLASRLPPDRLRDFLAKAAYGNAEVGAGAFWRGPPGALAISTEEQVAVVTKLYRGQLPVSGYALDLVRQQLVIARDDALTVSARAGGCAGNVRVVGAVARPGKAFTFALSVEGADSAEPWRETALRLLAGVGAL